MSFCKSHMITHHWVLFQRSSECVMLQVHRHKTPLNLAVGRPSGYVNPHVEHRKTQVGLASFWTAIQTCYIASRNTTNHDGIALMNGHLRMLCCKPRTITHHWVVLPGGHLDMSCCKHKHMKQHWICFWTAKWTCKLASKTHKTQLGLVPGRSSGYVMLQTKQHQTPLGRVSERQSGYVSLQPKTYKTYMGSCFRTVIWICHGASKNT